jgi:hypothetical protein
MRRIQGRWYQVAALLLIGGSAAQGATLLLASDGPAPYRELAQAVAAAAAGDEILIGPGTYVVADLCLDTDITMRALEGPEVTTLDGQDQSRLMEIEGPCRVTLAGLSFVHGWIGSEEGEGAVMYVRGGARVEVRDCIFADNAVGWDSGAIHVRHAGTEVTLSGCTFLRNQAVQSGGAAGVIWDAVLRVEDCLFVENTSDRIGAALTAWSRGRLLIRDSVFLRNAADAATVIIEEDASAEITGCTFHNNDSLDHGTILISKTDQAVIRRCIITGDWDGAGLVFLEATGRHEDNLYFGNAGGAILGDTLHASELVADPLYCDHLRDDLHLSPESPAWRPERGDWLGALGLGCDENAGDPLSRTPEQSPY